MQDWDRKFVGPRFSVRRDVLSLLLLRKEELPCWRDEKAIRRGEL